jgi:hypothetical protein
MNVIPCYVKLRLRSTQMMFLLVRVVGSHCYSHRRDLNLVPWRLTSKQANYGNMTLERSCLPIMASRYDASH